MTKVRLWTTYIRDFSQKRWIDVRPTKAQLEIAKQLGVKVQPDDTFLVLSERILDEISQAIGDTPKLKPTPKQIEFAEELNLDITEDSRRVAWGKLSQRWQIVAEERRVELRKLNADAIRENDLQIGDLVEHTRELDLFNGKVLEIRVKGIIKNVNSDGLISFSNTSYPIASAKDVKKARNSSAAKTSIRVKTKLKRITN